MKILTSLTLLLLCWKTAQAQREGAIVGKTANLNFRRYGTGRTILMLGDPAVSFAGTENVARRLSRRNAVVVYDPRGVGCSLLPRYDTSRVNLARETEDVESIRQVLWLPRMTLFVAPGGAAVAENYLRLFGQKVDGIIWLTGKKWVLSDPVKHPQKDSLLALSTRPAARFAWPEKPVLRLEWTDSQAFYQKIDQFIVQHRLDYVEPTPEPKPQKTRGPHGRGHLRRKRP